VPPGQLNGATTGTAETFQYFFHPDHLGSASYITDASGEVYQHLEYIAFGETFVEEHSNTDRTAYLFNGKELDEETGLYYYGARYYDPRPSLWQSVDPLAEKFPGASPYNYCFNNPITLVDPDGKEPIKPFAGTVGGFMTFFNSLGSGIGASKGATAHQAMLRMGQTEWGFQGPKPKNTGPFNTSKGNRYIYTKKGGWIDMSHFMFYAGRAYQNKLDGAKDPIGEAVQDGYKQEAFDQFGPTYSSYSYEDLPSDKFGADFSVNYFDSQSDLTFGEQLQNYLNRVLEATSPENAPNYKSLPETSPKKGEHPSRINITTKPVFVKGDDGTIGQPVKRIKPENNPGGLKPWEPKL
jgi:RHS repeat-associated protein